MIKRLATVVATIALILGMAACAESSEPERIEIPGTATAPTGPSTPLRPTPNLSPDEDAFVRTIREAYPNFVSGNTDREIIQAGLSVCNALDRGVSINTLAENLLNDGLDPKFSGGMVGASVNLLCPHHLHQLRNWA